MLYLNKIVAMFYFFLICMCSLLTYKIPHFDISLASWNATQAQIVSTFKWLMIPTLQISCFVYLKRLSWTNKSGSSKIKVDLWALSRHLFLIVATCKKQILNHHKNKQKTLREHRNCHKKPIFRPTNAFNE